MRLVNMSPGSELREFVFSFALIRTTHEILLIYQEGFLLNTRVSSPIKLQTLIVLLHAESQSLLRR